MAHESRRSASVLLVIVVLAAGAYLPSLKNRFTFDDEMVVADAAHLLSQPSLLPRLVTADYFTLSGESTYRPVTTLSYMLDWRIGGGAAWAFHLQSVLWHVLVASLALSLFRRLGVGPVVAGGAALLVAIHPIMTEAVDNISFREDVLATALGLSALLLFVRHAPRVPALNAVAAGTVLLLATLSKESAFAFVGLIPLTFWYVAPAKQRSHLGGLLRIARERRVELSAVAVAAGTFLALRFFIFTTAGTYATWPGESLFAGVATGAVAIGYYLGLLVLPYPLCPDYRGVVAPVTSVTDWRPWLALTVIAALAFLALRARNRAPEITWGLAWFFLALAPVANLVPIPVFMAERFVYLPFVGMALAVTAAFHRVARWVMVARTLAIVGLIALATLTWTRHAAWSSNEALWSTTLAHHPGAYGAMHGYAVALQEQGRFAESVPYLERALEIPMSDEERSRALGALGISHGRMRDLPSAAKYLTEALELRRNHKLHYNLGITLLMMNRLEEGERELLRAVELKEHYAQPYVPLADLAEGRGDTAEATRLRELHRSLSSPGLD